MGAALDELDEGIATLARERIGSNARGESEEGECNRNKAHDDEVVVWCWAWSAGEPEAESCEVEDGGLGHTDAGYIDES